MSVWFAIPSVRPAPEANAVLTKWRALGYKIALWRDAEEAEPLIADLIHVGTYPGYSLAVNSLVHEVLRLDPDCDWIVTGGDDTEPDPKRAAEEIARECTAHFGGTFGIMQPTGDPWVDHSIERICGCPWMGREFCERSYGGNGPFWPEYWHMFNDEELQGVSLKLGILWQRPDLMHLHRHWSRDDEYVKRSAAAPAFLKRANSIENWNAMKSIFETRKRAGFPGHELLAQQKSVAV